MADEEEDDDNTFDRDQLDARASLDAQEDPAMGESDSTSFGPGPLRHNARLPLGVGGDETTPMPNFRRMVSGHGSRRTDVGRNRMDFSGEEEVLSDDEDAPGEKSSVVSSGPAEATADATVTAPVAAPGAVADASAPATAVAGSSASSSAGPVCTDEGTAPLTEAEAVSPSSAATAAAAASRKANSLSNAMFTEFPEEEVRESFSSRNTMDRHTGASERSTTNSRPSSKPPRQSFNRASFTQLGAPRPSFQNGRISFNGGSRNSGGEYDPPTMNVKRISFSQIRRDQGDDDGLAGHSSLLGGTTFIGGSSSSSMGVGTGGSLIRSLRNPQPLPGPSTSSSSSIAGASLGALASADAGGLAVQSLGALPPMRKSFSGEGNTVERAPLRRNTLRSWQKETAQLQTSMPRPVFEGAGDIWGNLPKVSAQATDVGAPSLVAAAAAAVKAAEEAGIEPPSPVSPASAFPSAASQLQAPPRLDGKSFSSSARESDMAFLAELSKVAEEDLDCELPKVTSATTPSGTSPTQVNGSSEATSKLHGCRDKDLDLEGALEAEKQKVEDFKIKQQADSSQIKELEARSQRLEADNQALRKEMQALRQELESLKVAR